MFGLFDKLNDPENAHRERIAFLVAIVMTVAIGGVWFYWGGSTAAALSTPGNAVGNTAATSTANENSLDGPISNFRAEMADAAVFIAGQVRKIGDLWKGWSFGKPLEYQRQEY